MQLSTQGQTMGPASQQSQTIFVWSIGTVMVFLTDKPARGSASVTPSQSWRTDTSGRWAGFS